MRGTSRNRNLAAGNPPEKVVVTHSWLPYTLLSLLYAAGAIGWFATMIATTSYSSDSTVSDRPDGDRSYQSPMMSAFFAFINLYLFRMITLFASLAVTYHAERHYLSRGSAWTSWVVNTLLVFSWLATDLPFVYSAFSGFSGGAPIQNNGGDQGSSHDSMRTHFCSVTENYWCRLNTAHGVFSVYAGAVLLLTWLFACYQLKRARGLSNLLLTWPEVATINLITLGVISYLIWTLSTIPLGYTRQFGVFGFLESHSNALNTWRMSWPSLIWGNYLIHAAFFVALGSAAYISFGGTTAPRMSALIANWMSFMTLLPAAIYIDRHMNDIGQCNGDHFDTTLRCPSLNGVAAGMTIACAVNFLLGLTMFAVLMQAETADFAVDMYGDKARAIDDARSTGTLPVKDVAASYDTTRPSTPEHGYRAGGPVTGMHAPLHHQPAGAMPMARGEDVELGAPVY